MKILAILLQILTIGAAVDVCKNNTTLYAPSNQCIQFSISSGSGCAWMCNYCANQLGTNNYYFTDGVCQYQVGEGCTGSPVAGNSYICCSV